MGWENGMVCSTDPASSTKCRWYFRGWPRRKYSRPGTPRSPRCSYPAWLRAATQASVDVSWRRPATISTTGLAHIPGIEVPPMCSSLSPNAPHWSSMRCRSLMKSSGHRASYSAMRTTPDSRPRDSAILPAPFYGHSARESAGLLHLTRMPPQAWISFTRS